MDIGNPAGQRVVDRDHRQIGLAFANRPEGCLKGNTWQCNEFRISRPACQIRIGTRHPLESYGLIFNAVNLLHVSTSCNLTRVVPNWIEWPNYYESLPEPLPIEVKADNVLHLNGNMKVR